jgi:hypothetical protein
MALLHYSENRTKLAGFINAKNSVYLNPPALSNFHHNVNEPY